LALCACADTSASDVRSIRFSDTRRCAAEGASGGEPPVRRAVWAKHMCHAARMWCIHSFASLSLSAAR